MHSYHVVMTPAYCGAAKRGVFDHWKGETVPLRGPNRELIGEAVIKDVDHREDGNVYVVVETTIDADYSEIADVASLMRGRSSMSFSVKPEDVVLPHQPKRDDDVARWLKAKRDQDGYKSTSYWEIDAILDEYRARADYGLTLDADLSELPDGY